MMVGMATVGNDAGGSCARASASFGFRWQAMSQTPMDTSIDRTTRITSPQAVTPCQETRYILIENRNRRPTHTG